MLTKGFITIATGNEEYYQLANNLLNSYLLRTDSPLPFAILCDRENDYTAGFNDIAIFSHPENSYLDKLNIYEYLPYDINIFVDADCLVYKDINGLFDLFSEAADFSCFGRVLPLDDKTGWFEYENTGIYKDKIEHVIGLHGGIYYIRKSEISKGVLSLAKQLIPEYKSFKFKGKFSTPGDEPLIALAMAISKCYPIPFDPNVIQCYWETKGQIKLNALTGYTFVKTNKSSPAIVHWGTRNTREMLYKREAASINGLLKEQDMAFLKLQKLIYDVRKNHRQLAVFLKKGRNKCLRFIRSSIRKNGNP